MSLEWHLYTYYKGHNTDYVSFFFKKETNYLNIDCDVIFLVLPSDIFFFCARYFLKVVGSRSSAFLIRKTEHCLGLQWDFFH